MNKSKWLFLAFSILLLLIVVDVSPLASQEAANIPEANKALLMDWWQAEATHQYDQLSDFFAPNIVRHSVATTAIMPEAQVTNLEEYAQFLEGTAAMFPDYSMTAEMLTADGDYVAFYSTFSGTFAENGNHIEVPMVGFARFDGGKIAELWVEWDNVTWNTQMMAEPVEQPITSIDDVLGIWNVSIAGETYQMELTPDGLLTVLTPRRVDCSTRSSFSVAGGEIQFAASGALQSVGYRVFVMMENGKPASLRFVLDGVDACTARKEMLDGQTLLPAGPFVQPVTADLVGTWRWHYGEFYFQFRDDGTFRVDESLTNLDSTTVQDFGQFQVEDGVLTITSGAEARYCQEGDVGVYEAVLTDTGQLQLILQEDGCVMRRAPSTNPQPFSRVN